MTYCPNCGEIIMNGDPYCSHCGSKARTDDDYVSERAYSSEEIKVRDVAIESFFSVLPRFGIDEDTISTMKRDIVISKPCDGTVKIYRPFSVADLEITFERKNRYFSTTDTIHYNPFTRQITATGFYSDFTDLRDAEWFKEAVMRKGAEIGLEFYSCGGGYDAKFDLDSNTFELKAGCEVIAHFIKDDAYTVGFEVDFKNHGLKSMSKEYGRGNPLQEVMFMDY